MAQEIRTYQEIYDEILNLYAIELNVDASDLDISIKVEARVTAEVVHLLETKLSELQNNIYIDKAEEQILNRYGLAIIGRTIAPAVQGVYTVQVTGAIGSTIPADTIFVANDDTDAAGKFFILDSEYTTVSNPDTISLRALDAGLDSALSINDKLTSQTPLEVDDEVTVTVVTTPPSDKESINDYRDDILTGVRLLAQGGSPSDWILWATDEPTVRTVYSYHDPNYASNVILYVEATVAATSTDIGENPNNVPGVPTQATLDAIYKAPAGGNPEEGVVIWDEKLQKGRKPITVSNIISSPIEPVPVDIAFTGLTDTSIYTALRASVDALLYDKRPYVAGAIALEDKNDTLLFTEIILLIFNIINGTGATYTSVSMSVDGNPESSYTFTFGSIPYLRNITNTQ